MLKAHLSCRTITSEDAKFCPMCGKELTEKNTLPVNLGKIPVALISAIVNDHCSAKYGSIEEIL